jgi:hypothetical protein
MTTKSEKEKLEEAGEWLYEMLIAPGWGWNLITPQPPTAVQPEDVGAPEPAILTPVTTYRAPRLQ